MTRTTIAAALAACSWIGLAARADDGPRSRGKDRPTADPSAGMAVDADVASIGPAPGAMAGLIERFGADRTSIVRSPAPPELSTARDALTRRFASSWLRALDSVDYEGMSVDERVDYQLLKNLLRRDLRQVDLDARDREEAAPLLPFAPIVLDLDASRRRNERADGESAARALVDLKAKVDDARKQAEAALAAKPKAGDPTKPPTPLERAVATKSVANRAAGYVADLKRTLSTYLAHHQGYDPLFSWWTADPAKAASKALGDYETFLREKVVGVKPDDKTTIVGDPIGREALLADLESAMIPYSPEDLIAIAGREFAWCDAEMLRASRELGYGDDWKKALERVKTLHVPPGEQAALIRDLALEAIRYVEDNGLVSIPALAKDTWRIDMMSPEMQLVNPFFVYANGASINVSFPTSEMTHEQKLMSMRGNNRHFARATTFHELIPGHHLQSFMLGRYRTYRRPFSTPFWMEGWALYWETVLWDKGFTKAPEDRVGALFWRMHRCARIIFSLNFHLKKWTPQQCIDFLVDRVGHERDNASAEVRRSFNGNYGPLYQCAYMLGALQFRSLRREMVDSGVMNERTFHDAILREGGIPIEMVRAILARQKLPRDFKTSWKFAGDVPAVGPIGGQ